MNTNFPIIKVAARGATVASGAASASVAIPNDSTGGRAKRVYVAATVAAYIAPGASGVTAAAGDILLPVEQPIILDVGGQTHIAAIQVASAGVVSITPVEF